MNLLKSYNLSFVFTTILPPTKSVGLYLVILVNPQHTTLVAKMFYAFVGSRKGVYLRAAINFSYCVSF